MQLAPNEQIIKEWHYAHSKTKSESLDYSLVVTDKRIVNSSDGKLSHTRTEVSTKNVCGVDMSSKKSSLLLAFILLGIGAVALIVGIILATSEPDTSSVESAASGILPIIIGILLAIGGLIALIYSVYLFITAGASLEVRIYADATPYTAVSISSSNLRAKRAPSTKVVKMKVNKELGAEIIDCLGSILLAK